MTTRHWMTAVAALALLSNGARLLYYAWHVRSAPSIAVLGVSFVC
jgi:hypothetical protein